MTGWIIFGCIVLALIWIFTRFVTVTAVYDEHPELKVKILFFTITKVPPDPEKQKRKAAKKAAKEKKRAAKAMKKAEKQQKHAEKEKPRYNSALLDMADKDAKAGIEETSESSDSSDNAASGDEKQSEFVKKAAAGHKKKKSGKPGISFDMIRDYIASASPPVKRLFKKIRIRNVYIDWVVGTDDAAKTALKYGGLCAAIYSAVEWLCALMDTKIKEINIEADFASEKDDIFAYGVVKLRISTALGCAIWLGFRMLKTYLKYNSTPKKAQRPRPARAGAK